MFETFRIKAEDVYNKSLNNEIDLVYKAINSRTISGKYYILVEELSEVVRAMLVADGYSVRRRFDDKIKISWEKEIMPTQKEYIEKIEIIKNEITWL